MSVLLWLRLVVVGDGGVRGAQRRGVAREPEGRPPVVRQPDPRLLRLVVVAQLQLRTFPGEVLHQLLGDRQVEVGILDIYRPLPPCNTCHTPARGKPSPLSPHPPPPFRTQP